MSSMTIACALSDNPLALIRESYTNAYRHSLVNTGTSSVSEEAALGQTDIHTMEKPMRRPFIVRHGFSFKYAPFASVQTE
jgi:hypothetical protein